MSMIPVVASVADLDSAIQFGDRQPNSRWYIAKRAYALGASEKIPGSWSAVTAAIAAGDLNKSQRDALAAKGVSLDDGSYPVRNRTDLAKAVKAFGRAKNKAAAKKHIVKRARVLHSTDLLPDSWKPLTAAVAEAPSDEAGVWAQTVRDALTDRGADPDEVEAGTDGFAADYTEYRDTVDVYVSELLDVHLPADEVEPEADPEVEPDEGEVAPEVETPADPEPAVVPDVIDTPELVEAVDPPPVLEPSVEFAPAVDIEALAAAVAIAVVAALNPKDKPVNDAGMPPDLPVIDESLGLTPVPDSAVSSPPPIAAAEPPTVDPIAPPAIDPTVPDIEAAKAALRAKHGKPKPATPPVVPVVASAKDMRKAVLRKRMLAPKA